MNAKDSKFAVCRHIKTNGRRCQSPALTGGALCFFHRNLHQNHRRPPTAEKLMSTWQEETIQSFRDGGEDPLAIARAYPKQNEIHFPALEDAESVQLATSMLFQAIATGQIHFKRARLLLYTLKIAAINQRALARSLAASEAETAPTRIVRTKHGHLLAAPDEAPPTSPAEQTDAPTPSAQTSQLTAYSSQTYSSRSKTELSHPATDSESPTHPSPNSAPNPHPIRNLDITPMDGGFYRHTSPLTASNQTTSLQSTQ